MNRTKLNARDGYKGCAGTGCTNMGLYLLRVRFVNKNGWFCSSCKKSLLADMLLEEIEESSVNREAVVN
ncbi:MAG: hypothetical protein WBF33_32385 [Candidatus Nitrosopolaris sp.]